MGSQAQSHAPRYPRRPPRLPEVFPSTSGIFFVTFNTHQRRPLLACAEMHEAFRNFCKAAPAHGVAVGRYVIMPDHVHCFVRVSAHGVGLARWVQSLRAALGRTLTQRGQARPHWQEGFFDHLLRSHESYDEKTAYVALNPVRKGLVPRQEDWPYQGVASELRM